MSDETTSVDTELPLEPKNGSETAKTGRSTGPRPPRGPHFDPADPSAAIEWLRCAVESGHQAGCQCHRCAEAKPIARVAVDEADCGCDICPVCWAGRQVKGGRI